MVFVPKLTPYFLFNLNLILIGPNLLFSLSSRTSFSSSSVTFRFLILCGFLDWFFNPSMPYVSYRLFHLYHVALETPNAMQTSDILLPERSGSIIILYLFSIISTCYYTPRLECQPCQELKCQPCMEAAHLVSKRLTLLWRFTKMLIDGRDLLWT